MACLAVVIMSVIMDDTVSDTFAEGVKLLSYNVLLAVAEVIVALLVLGTWTVVVILDESIVGAVVSSVDSEDDSNSVMKKIKIAIQNTSKNFCRKIVNAGCYHQIFVTENFALRHLLFFPHCYSL